MIEKLRGRVVPSYDGVSATVSAPKMEPWVLDIGSSASGVRLQLPANMSASATAFTRDGTRIVGIGTDAAKDDHIMIWSASDGKLQQSVAFPRSAIYIYSTRVSPARQVVYCGSKWNVFAFDIQKGSLTTIAANLPDYVQDIAEQPGGPYVAYIDGYSRFHQWDRSKRAEAAPLFHSGAERRESIVPRSVDYSADGSQFAVAGWSSRQRTEVEEKCEVVRCDAFTGNVIQRTIVDHEILRVRYVGDTKTLLLEGRGAGSMTRGGWFGFLASDSVELILRYELPSWISVTAVELDRSAHVTIGLVAGAVLQWRKEDWPPDWTSLFAK